MKVVVTQIVKSESLGALRNTMMVFLSSNFLILALLLVLTEESRAWQQCTADDGGGSCPNRNTCCSTAVVGTSSCIPSKKQDPDNALGQCCDGETGCGYGYQCATDQHGQPYCEIRQDHPSYLYNDTARYNLCRVPSTMQTLWGFPIPNVTLRAGYYSNMGDITNMTDNSSHLQVDTALIIVHGSDRNADDYFCTALSLLDNDLHTLESTLIIAPWFASPEDTHILDDLLLWADKESETSPLSHSWRYGADAINAPISSYGVLDSMVEYLVTAKVQFPNLRRIAVAGHSAGGQVTHRWSLLSNSPTWSHSAVTIVSVVANPRSYCYLDGRRFLHDGSFDIPDTDSIQVCPNYNQWQWGLEQGGILTCPYKDRALLQTPAKVMAQRYATRNVVYLAGEFDILPANDGCETSVFQGPNRQQRAKFYVQGLQKYFGRNVHELHIVEGSPHDHMLMFQSQQGRRAIFGHDQENVM